jgi:membrane protease YdiL (CAAX protease family)
MEHVLYVREPERDGSPRTPRTASAYAPKDLAAEGGRVQVTADTEVALSENGPFEPLAPALLHQGPLRDVLAAAIPVPSLRGHDRLRLGVAVAAAAPVLMLLELDRELLASASAGHGGITRLVIDVTLAAAIGVELSRRTPRVPGIVAVGLIAVALRFCLVTARLCGGPQRAHPLLFVAAAVPALAAFVVLSRMPSDERVTLELLGKLGVSRAAFFDAIHEPEPSGAAIAGAVACAAGAPALLQLARAVGAGVAGQVAAFVAVALVGPVLARRLDDGRHDRARSPARIAAAAAAGLVLTMAAVTAAKVFLDTGTELARCFDRLDVETRTMRAAEAAELARAVANVRGSGLLFVSTTLVFPFAEERVYRGALQDVLARRYGTAYGVFAAALAFGIAHAGIYHVALYQTVLLGVGFGVAYASGGFFAAFAVHAAWNILQLL